MSTNGRYIYIVLLLLSIHLTSWGQSNGDNSREYRYDSISVSVHFRFDDASLLSDYRTNTAALVQFDSLFSADNLVHIEKVFITGTSSPEGNSLYNERLANRRASSLSKYLKWKYPGLSSDKITINTPKNLHREIFEKVYNDTSIPQHGEVMKRLEGSSAFSIKIKKETLPEDSYRYIQQQIYPFFRSAISCVVYFKTEVQMKDVTEMPINTAKDLNINKEIITSKQGDTTKEIVENSEVTGDKKSEGIFSAKDSLSPELLTDARELSTNKTESTTLYNDRMKVYRPLFALKTNLLFDLASALNIELEVPIGRRWSVAGEWIFPWWLWEKKQHCLQVLSGNLEGRYWFGDRSQHKILTGWFGGLYAGGGIYDLEWNKNGYQGEFFIAMGVSAGYAHPIGRNLRMEYSLGIGYLKTDYRKYDALRGKDEQWHLIRRENGNFSWFGPTRAKVSLVWVPQFKFYQKGGTVR